VNFSWLLEPNPQGWLKVISRGKVHSKIKVSNLETSSQSIRLFKKAKNDAFAKRFAIRKRHGVESSPGSGSHPALQFLLWRSKTA
jgi:hypothetical protein